MHVGAVERNAGGGEAFAEPAEQLGIIRRNPALADQPVADLPDRVAADRRWPLRRCADRTHDNWRLVHRPSRELILGARLMSVAGAPPAMAGRSKAGQSAVFTVVDHPAKQHLD